MFKLTSLAFIILVAIFAQFTSFAGLIFVSMVLQASSVLDVSVGDATASISKVSSYGVTPFLALSFVAGLLLLISYFKKRHIYIPKIIYTPLIFLILYALTATIGAFILPNLFSGIPVHLLIDITGAEKEAQPLLPTISNLVQALNLLIILIVLTYLIQASRTRDQKIKVVSGVIGAWILALMIGLYEQAASQFTFSSLNNFLGNNPGYLQAPLTTLDFGINRIGLPFTEPSYASAYMASITIGLFSVFFWGKNWWWIWFAAIISLIGLLNTMGSTGLAATIIAFLITSSLAIIKSLSTDSSLSRRLRAAILLILILLASTWGASTYNESSIKPRINSIVHELLIYKAKKTNGVREMTNKRAIEIFFQTKGLGVGLGSNRASSYFASMLSNTGILGFFFFMGMLVTLMWRYWKARALTDMQIFVAGALPTATLAMGLGIPDLNMPMYWGFIFLGFIFCPDETPLSEPATQINDVVADKSPLESRA